MAEFTHYSSQPRTDLVVRSSNGTLYIDYKRSDDLHRLLTPNGKIQSRKRTGLSAKDQRMAARAIKRARFIGLLAFTSATL